MSSQNNAIFKIYTEKTALFSGAAGGIGLAAAKEFGTLRNEYRYCLMIDEAAFSTMLKTT